MRTQALWIIALIGWWLWSQTSWGQPPEELVSGLDREPLLQRKAELQQQKEALDVMWRSELGLRRQADEYYEKHHLLQTDLPLPGIPWGRMALVKVESVRRADDEVLRAYPASSPYLHYYEVQARVIKVWIEEWSNHFMEAGQVRVSAGTTLSLLWAGIQKVPGGEAPLPCIWERDRVYLVFSLSPAPKAGIPKLRPNPHGGFPTQPWSSPHLQDYWWIPYIQDNLRPLHPRFGDVDDILHYASSSAPSFNLSGEVTSRIESPPAAVLRVLDEEAEFFRLPRKRATQLAWVKQRVLDKNLPLWKRQRALVFWFLADNAQKEVPVSQHDELYVQQQIEYLTFLNGLSEPLLQAHGLRTMWIRPGCRWSVSLALVSQWLEALAPFLAADRPAEVRREAAAMLCECIVRPGGYHWLSTNREWALERARQLREQAEQEKDPVVRARLSEAWRFIAYTDIKRQLEAIEKRLRELGLGGQ
jgi:hypothetical protein